MKKIIIATIITGVGFGSLGYAGSMGPMSQVMPSSVPYVGLEGSYSWNQTDGFRLNSQSPNISNQPWGGRLSAGIVRPYSERLRFSGELGGGYYGSTNVNNVNGVTSSRTIDGYDFLVGALYNINQFDVFGNVGVMLQNYRIKVTRNLGDMFQGNVLTGTYLTDSDRTQALPEIKVGAIYNPNDFWGISLAYMHVFGTDVKGNSELSGVGTLVPPATTISMNGANYMQNPSLDSIFLGLRYKFA